MKLTIEFSRSQNKEQELKQAKSGVSLLDIERELVPMRGIIRKSLDDTTIGSSEYEAFMKLLHHVDNITSHIIMNRNPFN